MSMENLAQSVYRIVNGSKNAAVGASLVTFIALYQDWANDFISELELETDWNWWRVQDNNFGTASNTTPLTMPTDFRKLVVNLDRPLYLQQDGTTVATFLVVDPNNVNNPADTEKEDRVTFINGNLVFSRVFKDEELGSTIFGDYMQYAPQITSGTGGDAVIDVIQPYKLLTLGIAKDVSLPDLVQGGISPNIEQRYLKTLSAAIAQNAQSVATGTAPYDSYSSVGGIY